MINLSNRTLYLRLSSGVEFTVHAKYHHIRNSDLIGLWKIKLVCGGNAAVFNYEPYAGPFATWEEFASELRRSSFGYTGGTGGGPTWAKLGRVFPYSLPCFFDDALTAVWRQTHA